MRLMGSFQTIATHGRSGRTSSAASGRSSSTGAVLTMSSLTAAPLNHRAHIHRNLPLVDHSTTSLLTDRYELTMVRGALASGTAARRAIFEVFARHLPAGRRYGVVAGIGRLLDALVSDWFYDPALEYLTSHGIVDEPTAEWLSSYRFSGNIWGYAEGDLYFPGSPILVVEAGFAEAVILETIVLSILNHDSAIASAASRMVRAA